MIRNNPPIELAARIYRARARAESFVQDCRNMFRPWLDAESYEEGYLDGSAHEDEKRRLWIAQEQGYRTQVAAILANHALGPGEALAQIRELTK